MEAKYGLKLPRRVITIDYGEDGGDLFIKFRHAGITEGESIADGKVIVHFDKKGRTAAFEVTDITAFSRFCSFRAVGFF
jgi:hypothetical protein